MHSILNALAGPGPDVLVYAAYLVVPLVLLRHCRRVAPRDRPLVRLLALFAVAGGLTHAFGMLEAARPQFAPAANAAAVVVAWGAALVALRYLPRALARVEEEIHGDDLAQYRLLEAAVLASGDGILIADAGGSAGPALRIAFANPAFGRMTGYSDEEAVGLSPSILCGEDTEAEAAALQTIRDAMQSDTPVQFEVPGRRKDGTRLWAEWQVVPVVGPGGVCTHRVAVLRDTTGRRLAEDALRERTAFLKTVIAHIPCGVFWKDRDSVFLGCNDQMAQDHGFARSEDLLGRTDFTLPGQTPAEAEFYRECDRRVVAGGAAMLNFEEIQTRPDGSRVTLLTSKVPLRDAAGDVVGVLGIYQDITARLTLERQLREAAKLEVVGKLAGAIAHDFNNLLTVVIGNAELLQMAGGDPRDRANLLADIGQAADRGAGLVRQLLMFSKSRPPREEVVDLNATVTGLERILARWLGERVSVRLRLRDLPVRVRGDKSQLDQVVMNLAVNARDAMPGGGTLTISTELDHDPRTRGPVARLVVTDTGTGMTDEVRARIFEPFFTTKDAGKGSGIGLATVHGIVEQAGGRIEVESELGAGTTFRVTLPSCGGQPTAASRVTDTPAPGATGFSVLLVEDEPQVRKFARRTLEANGYVVTEAPDGEAALQLLTPDEPFDLLVTDLSMPRMNGEEVAARVRAAQPWVGVVFMSGGPADAVRLELVPGALFLPKPFPPADLLRAARKVLKLLALPAAAPTA